MDKECRNLIKALHIFIADWLTGRVAKTAPMVSAGLS